MATWEAGAVEKDVSKNKIMRIYLATLGAGGVTLMVLSYLQGWGFWGWFGGGFLVVAGLGGLAGMAMTGGAGKLSCPACHGEIKVLHISQSRIMPCPHCKAFLEGAEQMAPVAGDRISDHPAFLARLPDSIAWPEGCPVCGAPVTRLVKVEGTSFGGDMAVMVSPVSVQKVYTIQAPACDRHADGVGLFIVSKDEGKLQIGFRSFAYWNKFCDLNGTSL